MNGKLNTLLAGALLALVAFAPAFAADEETKPAEKKRVVVRVPGEEPHVFVFDGEGEPDHLYRVAEMGKTGFLGIGLLDLTPELREHFGVPGKDGGVMVSKVEPDSPAAKAGIRVGDIVTGLGPKKVESGWDLRRRVRELKDGEAVTLEVVRDRRVQTIQATAVQRERNIVDLRELSIPGDINIQIDQERLQKQIQESMKHFNSPDFQARLERHKDLEKRLKELEQRLQEMEQKLQK